MIKLKIVEALLLKYCSKTFIETKINWDCKSATWSNNTVDHTQLNSLFAFFLIQQYLYQKSSLVGVMTKQLFYSLDF